MTGKKGGGGAQSKPGINRTYPPTDVAKDEIGRQADASCTHVSPISYALAEIIRDEDRLGGPWSLARLMRGATPKGAVRALLDYDHDLASTRAKAYRFWVASLQGGGLTMTAGQALASPAAVPGRSLFAVVRLLSMQEKVDQDGELADLVRASGPTPAARELCMRDSLLSREGYADTRLWIAPVNDDGAIYRVELADAKITGPE